MSDNLYDLFRSRFPADRSRPFIETETGRVYSYADLEAESNRLAHYLQSQGVGPGDHVGIYAKNSVEHVVALARAAGSTPDDSLALSRGEDPMLATRSVASNPIVRYVADLLARSGEKLRAGDFIIAGSVVPPIQLDAHDEEIADAEHRGQQAHAQPADVEPEREHRPDLFAQPRIEDVGHHHRGEEGDRERHHHRVDRVPEQLGLAFHGSPPLVRDTSSNRRNSDGSHHSSKRYDSAAQMPGSGAYEERARQDSNLRPSVP